MLWVHISQSILFKICSLISLHSHDLYHSFLSKGGWLQPQKSVYISKTLPFQSINTPFQDFFLLHIRIIHHISSHNLLPNPLAKTTLKEHMIMGFNTTSAKWTSSGLFGNHPHFFPKKVNLKTFYFLYYINHFLTIFFTFYIISITF